MTTARPNSQPGQAQRADGRGGALDARIKRSAWLLASFAILFYVGFIVYYFCAAAEAEGMRRAVDRGLALKLVAIVGAMFAFGFALVPLYDVFCSLTGFGGKTAGVARPPRLDEKPDESRIVRVEFVASVPRGAPWEFAPNATHLRRAPRRDLRHALSRTQPDGRALVGQAVPSIAPGTRGPQLQQDRVLLLHAAGVRAAREAASSRSRSWSRPSCRRRSRRSSLAYTFFTVPDQKD